MQLSGLDEFSIAEGVDAGSGAAGAGASSGGTGGTGGTGASATVRRVLGERPMCDVTGVTEDTNLDSSNHTLNSGGREDLWADAEPVETIVIRFDLADLPADAVVERAVLELWTWDDENAALEAGEVEAALLLEPWYENSLDDAPGVANWDERLVGSDWGSPGAVSEPSVSSELAGSFFPDQTDTAFALVLDESLVQQWIESPETNFGIRLMSTDDDDAAGFHASESSASDKRPALSVDYHQP